MTPAPYTVTVSPRVADSFRELVLRSGEVGLTAELIADFRRVIDVLEVNPSDVGESRDYLATLRIHTRVWFEGWLVVRYGIHEAAKIVWVQSIGLQRKRG